MDNKLQKKFIVPPFSVLDAKQKYWQDRKRMWLHKGIKSEVGRKEGLTFSENTCISIEGKDTSVFDPVLCELMYKWFCPINGKILDFFAGGSVRGVVAGELDYDYTGIELSKTQVEANFEQFNKICPTKKVKWICGDSNVELDKLTEGTNNWGTETSAKYDFLFTCPPYFNLEVYSNDPADLSNKSYNGFLELYESIIKKAIDKLKNNRFACIVVGDVRDKEGFYVNFVEDTVKIFEKHGMKKYNEIILLNAISSASMRANNYMTYRKVAKIHQNVLIFYKGNPKTIKTDFEILSDFEQKQQSL